MAGRELPGTPKNTKATPTVQFKAVGQTFVGNLKSVKPNPKKPSQKIWTFGALDGTAPITIKTEGGYVPAQINEGDEVSLFGLTDIDDKLTKAVMGEKIEITFTGTKPTPNGTMKLFRVIAGE
jgi:hypothetical protein